MEEHATTSPQTVYFENLSHERQSVRYACAVCGARMDGVGAPRACGHDAAGITASVSATATGEGGM